MLKLIYIHSDTDRHHHSDHDKNTRGAWDFNIHLDTLCNHYPDCDFTAINNYRNITRESNFNWDFS